MRQLRRKYAEEQAELRQQQTLLSRQRFQEKKLQQEKLRQDIIAYKRQQQIKGLDLTVGGVDSVALVVEDKEKGEQGVNNTSSSSFDRLIESRRSTWHRLKKQVREARLDTHLSLLQETSLARQEQLLYLFYSASDFVTLDNLDAKLDQVVAESAQPSHTHSYFPANLDIMQSSLTSKSASEKAKEVDGLVQELKETLSGSEDTAKPDLLQLERKREELEEENEL